MAPIRLDDTPESRPVTTGNNAWARRGARRSGPSMRRNSKQRDALFVDHLQAAQSGNRNRKEGEVKCYSDFGENAIAEPDDDNGAESDHGNALQRNEEVAIPSARGTGYWRKGRRNRPPSPRRRRSQARSRPECAGNCSKVRSLTDAASAITRPSAGR